MRLADALADRHPLLADGAMGTSLIASGLAIGDAPERWTLSHPDRVALVHRSFVAAGADILLTNSFGANACRLGDGRDVAALNARAAGLAKTEARAAARRVWVAGSVGPTGARVGTDITLTDMTAIFVAQIEALADGGADLVWIETMSDLPEIGAAVAAAARVGLPAVVTASFHATAPGGLDPATFAAAMGGLSPPVQAIGANCGTGPYAMLATIATLRASTETMPLIAKPNAGLPIRQDDRLRHPIGPDAMAVFAVQAVAAGAGIVGGCCGTAPAHIAAMRRALDGAYGPGPVG